MLFLIYDDFLLTNLWWIAGLSVLVLIGAWFLADYLIKKSRKGKGETPMLKKEQANMYIEALGGLDNIIDKSLVGSRIVLTLKDYTGLKKDVLEKAGVTGFILMSDKLTLVVKEGAEEVYKSIFGE